MTKSRTSKITRSAAPLIGQHAREIQAFGSVVSMPIALAADVRRASADNLNQLLADTISLRDLYKKHHWQVAGHTFYQLHLLFDKHFGEQNGTACPAVIQIAADGVDDDVGEPQSPGTGVQPELSDDRPFSGIQPSA